MAYKKYTVIIPLIGKITCRAGHYTDPKVLGKMNALIVTYGVYDTSGKGRSGKITVYHIDGLDQKALKHFAAQA